MEVTIIGTGNMARGIGSRVLAGGHDLTVVGKDSRRAEAVAADIGGAGIVKTAVVAGDGRVVLDDTGGDQRSKALPYIPLDEPRPPSHPFSQLTTVFAIRLDPLGAPGRRLPGLAEVDPLVDDLLVTELHDPNGHHRSVVVADCVLVDPEVVAAGGPV